MILPLGFQKKARTMRQVQECDYSDKLVMQSYCETNVRQRFIFATVPLVGPIPLPHIAYMVFLTRPLACFLNFLVGPAPLR